MFIIIKDKKQLIEFNLISKFDYLGLHFYKTNNNYYLKLDSGYYFVQDEKVKSLELTKYDIKSENNFYVLEVFVYENDDGFSDYKLIEAKELLISENKKANIVCLDRYLKDKYLLIKDGYIETNYDISVNNLSYTKQKLKNGDLIKYLGNRIIYYDNFYYLNTFKKEINLKLFVYQEKIVKYNQIYTNINFHPSKHFCELQLEEINDYKKPNIIDNSNLLKNFIPAFFMCLAMSLMIIANFNNSPNTLAKASSLMSLIATSLTTLICPFIFSMIDKHHNKKILSQSISEYIAYLTKYEERLKKNLDDYLKQNNKLFFDVENKENDLFCTNKDADDYLTLSIGKINKSFALKHSLTGIKLIDDKLNDIKELSTKINTYPFLLDLKKYRRVSIYAKSDMKYYFSYKYLLELTYKHSYDELSVGIFTLDHSILQKVYNLPHLFVNGLRNIYFEHHDLKQVDQRKYDKPFVMFILDKCAYEFSNPNIIVIYFSDVDKDLYKGSTCLLDYTKLNNRAYFEKTSIDFTSIEKDYDFTRYFNLLGSYLKIEQEGLFRFKDLFKESDIIHNYSIKQVGLKTCFAYNEYGLLDFDLHENAQGPHGLIAGSTGSGKSELIISLLLSLCLRYNPEYLNIVLIDYKGAGIESSLSYAKDTIPHIVASISNLEQHNIERLLITLANEAKRRETLFKELSNLVNKPIMNLDDYLNNNKEFNYPNIAYLLIVVDEFAELKKHKPELIQELVSLSRIGRSLGFNLILATQKPAGVVDEEIMSNSRFKIALKLFDEKDSLDLIRNNKAALITNKGEFYLAVDESLTKASSIYAKYVYTDIQKQIDVLDINLKVNKTIKNIDDSSESEAQYYVRKINEASLILGFKPYYLTYRAPLITTRNKTIIDKLVLGVIDDYYNGRYESLTYEINSDILISSTRSKEINAILNNLNELNKKTLVLANQEYANSSIVASLTYNQEEDLEFLFTTLLESKNLDCCFVIEDLNCLLAYNENYVDYLFKIIRRKDEIGVNLIWLCKNPTLSYKIINSFAKRLTINIDDTSMFFNTKSKYYSACYYLDDEVKGFVPNKIEEFLEEKSSESFLRHIPETILPDANNALLGYDEKTRLVVNWNNSLLIVSNNDELLKRYQNAYGDRFVYQHYDASLLGRIYENILWLGYGLHSQRLFYTTENHELTNEEGLLYTANKSIRLRIING